MSCWFLINLKTSFQLKLEYLLRMLAMFLPEFFEHDRRMQDVKWACVCGRTPLLAILKSSWRKVEPLDELKRPRTLIYRAFFSDRIGQDLTKTLELVDEHVGDVFECFLDTNRSLIRCLAQSRVFNVDLKRDSKDVALETSRSKKLEISLLKCLLDWWRSHGWIIIFCWTCVWSKERETMQIIEKFICFLDI